MKKIVSKRWVIQLIFFIIAVGVTINHTLVEKGIGISGISSGYIHYVCPVCGVTTIYQYFVSSADWITKLLNPVTFVIIITMIVAIFFGPIFCGWICPFGAYQDFIAKVFGKRVAKKKYNKLISKKVDSKLRYLRYVSLGVVIYMTAKSAVTVLESINPYHALLNLFVGEFAIIGLIFLALITITSLFVHRPWCKYLCPYGAFLGIFNIFRVKAIVREPSTCIGCKKCDKVCPMNIEVESTQVVRDHQCISCMECTSEMACPKEDTVKMKGTKGIEEKIQVNARNIIAFVAAILLLVGTTALIKLNPTSSGDTDVSAAGITTQLDGNYEDGIYTGTGTGFNTGLTVEITIENNQIIDLEITSHNETVGYYEVAFEEVPTSIVENQSTEVDTVSGATRSSEGIIEAVNDALSQASIDGDTTSTETTTEEASDASTEGGAEGAEEAGKEDAPADGGPGTGGKPEGSPEGETDSMPEDAPDDAPEGGAEGGRPEGGPGTEEGDTQGGGPGTGEGDAQGGGPETGTETETNTETESNPASETEESSETGTIAETGIYTDGIYTGSAQGYGGLVTVEVTIENGNISNIEVIDDTETPSFLEMALSVIDSIVGTQSTDVDTVTSATKSSNAIINATNEALEEAQ